MQVTITESWPKVGQRRGTRKAVTELGGGARGQERNFLDYEQTHFLFFLLSYLFIHCSLEMGSHPGKPWIHYVAENNFELPLPPKNWDTKWGPPGFVFRTVLLVSWLCAYIKLLFIKIYSLFCKISNLNFKTRALYFMDKASDGVRNTLHWW